MHIVCFIEQLKHSLWSIKHLLPVQANSPCRTCQYNQSPKLVQADSSHNSKLLINPAINQWKSYHWIDFIDLHNYFDGG